MGKNKRLWQRVYALLVMFALALGLASCGGSGSTSTATPQSKALAKYWVCESLEADGKALEPATFGLESFADFMAFIINENGTAVLVSFGEGQNCTWEQKDDKLIFSAQGETSEATLEADKLVVEEEEAGSKVRVTLAPSDKAPQYSIEDALPSLEVNFSQSETCQMGTYICEGLYTFYNDKIIGAFWDADSKKPSLVQRGFQDNDGNLSADNQVTLVEDCYPHYVQVSEGYVYYLNADEEGNLLGLSRVSLSGGTPEVLYDKACQALCLRGDKLYFTDENNHYVSCSLDGSNMQTVIDKEVYYPYFVDDDWVLYQDDADGETLHLMQLSSGFDARITQVTSYYPVIDGSTLWYGGKSGDKVVLHKMDLSSYNAETHSFSDEEGTLNVGGGAIPFPEYLYLPYFASGEKSNWGRSEWQQMELRNYDESDDYYVICYVGETYQISREARPDGVQVWANKTGSAVGFSL